MTKTVEIPDELHEQLERRAQQEGVTVAEYLAQRFGTFGGGVTPPEVLDRIRSRPRVDLGIAAADLIRQGREERAQQLIEPWSSSTPQR
jgi:hypothetical protein